MAFNNLPILWVFSLRNNCFMWLTGWSFSTFMTFHRHISRIVMIQLIVHASTYSAYQAACKSPLALAHQSETLRYTPSQLLDRILEGTLLADGCHGMCRPTPCPEAGSLIRELSSRPFSPWVSSMHLRPSTFVSSVTTFSCLHT